MDIHVNIVWSRMLFVLIVFIVFLLKPVVFLL